MQAENLPALQRVLASENSLRCLFLVIFNFNSWMCYFLGKAEKDLVTVCLPKPVKCKVGIMVAI